jgi:hypothetical protein
MTLERIILAGSHGENMAQVRMACIESPSVFLAQPLRTSWRALPHGSRCRTSLPDPGCSTSGPMAMQDQPSGGIATAASVKVPVAAALPGPLLWSREKRHSGKQPEPISHMPWDYHTPDTSAAVCCDSTLRWQRGYGLAPLDAWRKPEAPSGRVFRCHRIARLLPCRATHPSYAYSRRSHGLPAGLDTRYWPMDCHDPHDAVNLLRDAAVPAPSVTCPAPQG